MQRASNGMWPVSQCLSQRMPKDWFKSALSSVASKKFLAASMALAGRLHELAFLAFQNHSCSTNQALDLTSERSEGSQSHSIKSILVAFCIGCIMIELNWLEYAAWKPAMTALVTLCILRAKWQCQGCDQWDQTSLECNRLPSVIGDQAYFSMVHPKFKPILDHPNPWWCWILSVGPLDWQQSCIQCQPSASANRCCWSSKKIRLFTTLSSHCWQRASARNRSCNLIRRRDSRQVSNQRVVCLLGGRDQDRSEGLA